MTEPAKNNKNTKIGVYVCECGINIGSVVNSKKVAEYAGHLPNVAVARYYKYMCSDPGQELIKKDIKEKKLDKVVVASCSPRMHEPTFRAVVEECGLNPYCFEMANIREQCSWVHTDTQKATEKAMSLIKGAVSRASYLEPLPKKEVPVTPRALVIGGGIAGIQTALEIAEKGYKTYVVERTPSIGGRMAQLDKTFPTLDCSACILTPKMVDVARHPNIELLTYSEVESIDGYIGNFTVKVRKKPRYVTDACTGCGECAAVCPVEFFNEFDVGLGKRKAVYVPFPQAVPLKYTIDKKGRSPCIAACPAGVKAHGYVALIGQRKYTEALNVVRDTLPFPSICGRGCHHPCEQECNRNQIDEPVGVRFLKRFIADWAREHNEEFPESITPDKKEKIAVVGAGPAGLTCGLQLLKKGYHVTIYDNSPEPGGLLTNCIPGYRIPKDIAQYDVDWILSHGLHIENKTVGTDILLKDLQKEYDAVFVAVGAQGSTKIRIEGSDLNGVFYGMEFLKDVKKSEDKKPKERKPEHFGKNVVVIGGGNVAIDSARSALRLGSNTTILYRRSRQEMPAFDWEIEEAEEEGIDIQFLVSPVKIVGKKKVEGIEVIKMELGEPDESGRRRPVPVDGSEFVIKTDTVILAIGQKPELTGFEEVNTTSWGTLVVDTATSETNTPGVFAGGDIVRGPSSIIEAVADGNKAAECIHGFIQGLPPQEEIEYETAELPDGYIEPKKRVEPPKRDPAKRIKDFKEVEQRIDEETAVKEALRCLDCGGCSECLECVKACSELQAVDHTMREEIVDLEVGVIVVATGFDMYDPSEKPEYGYNGENVITGLEFERLVNASGPTGGKIKVNGKYPENVVFIQCVGSRDKDGHEYCSRVCCMYTAKQAHLIREKIPDANVIVYYTDVRAFGKGFEEFYNRVQREGVEYKRRELDDYIEVIPGNNGVTVKAEDHPDIKADLVVLATGIVPRKDTKEFVRIANINQSADGFLLEAHPKLRPVDTFTDGIFLAGCCQSPKDIPDTVAQASAAAARASAPLSQGTVVVEAISASIDETICAGCRICESLCEYSALSFDPEKKVMTVNDVMCKGCGVCSCACPSGAISMNHFNMKQMLAQVRGIIEREVAV
ncbi:MAG: FAD-dependent oxidoreductase [Candidatus Methanofastidiosia archaeon]|jgi:heterodisulfide reductase subunit A